MASYYSNPSDQQTSRAIAAFAIMAIVLFLVIMLVGRECVNWYFKHNSMLSELERLRKNSEISN
jgi:hypothetical protein